MKYKLHKMSSPGWARSFWTLKGLAKELDKWVCTQCIIEDRGDWSEHIGLVDFEEATFRTSLDNLPPIEKIGELLSTACGAEFAVNDKLEVKLNEYYKLHSS